MTKFPYPEVLLLLFEEAAESCPGEKNEKFVPDEHSKQDKQV